MLISAIALGLTGCKDDEDEIVTPVPDHNVTFFASSQLMQESDSEELVKLTLDKPASISGTIKIRVYSEHMDRVTTTPAAEDGIVTLAVEKNQTDVQFKIVPVNNTTVDGDATVKLTLLEVSKGFKFGATTENNIIIEDDDVPVKAHFLLNIGSIRENRSQGLDVVIVLSDFPAPQRTVAVAFESPNAVYGTDFITEPAPVNGKIQMTTVAGNDYVFFRLLPIDDHVIGGDQHIRFTLEQTDDQIEVGDLKNIDIDIADDESFSVHHVQDVRELYEDENLILDDMIVVATVTSIDNVVPNTLFIEDETGGIAIRLLFQHNFSRGDQLKLNLGYGLLKESDGVLTVHQVSEAEKVGISVLSYKLLTMEELNASQEDLEGQMVQLEGGLTFPEADGVKTMKGDRTVTDGTNTIIVRTLDQASFKNELVPSGHVMVRGIITEVNGNYILYPQVFADDVVEE